MPTPENQLPHEGYRDTKEIDEEAEFTVAWVKDVLKHRYIDGEIEELHRAASAFDNPTLETVPGLDMAAVVEMQRLIYAECDNRTTEGLADLTARYEKLGSKIRIVAKNSSHSGQIHAALDGLQRDAGDTIYPVSRGEIIEGEVLEISFNGERQTL